MASDIANPDLLAMNEGQLKCHPSVQTIINNRKIVNGPQFDIVKLNCAEVEKALKDLATEKSMGHDGIPNTILKIVCQELAPSLRHIFHKCIEECYWPTEWKKGERVPLHKKGSTCDVKNITDLLHCCLQLINCLRNFSVRKEQHIWSHD